MLEYTREELYLEYLEDVISENELAAYPRHVAEAGTFARQTGDPVGDEWERQISEGKTPDFFAAFSAEDREKLRQALGGLAGLPEEFHDTYGDK